MNYSTVENLQAIVKESIEKAERLESKIPETIANLRGFSSPKIRHLLNNLCSYEGCKYLEIGVWAGSTLIPALWKNGVTALTIDNYSQFGIEEAGFDAQKTAFELLEKYKDEIGRQGIWGGDCMTLPSSAIKRANVFFYDGAHDEDSTRFAIEKYSKCIADPFILVVDDWELTDSVKTGTIKALDSVSSETTWVLEKKNGYHEGIFIAVVKAKEFKKV